MDVKQVQLRDFTGGLNLRAERPNLRLTEVQDCLDVDFLPQGGFRQRRGMAGVISVTSAQYKWMDTFKAWSTGQEYLLIGVFDGTNYSVRSLRVSDNNTGTITSGATAATLGGYGAAFKDKYYIPFTAAIKTIDTALTLSAAYGTTFNDNLAAPAGTNFPLCLTCVVYAGYMWAANTTETAVNFPNRVRFSHPNNADNWRTNDYIDINPGDGDAIMAVVALQDRLIVFKQTSVWAVYGYSPDTFQVVQIASRIGAAKRQSICHSDNGIIFVSKFGEVWSYDGSEFKLLSENIPKHYFNDGTGTIGYGVAFGGEERRRIWVSTGNGASTWSSDLSTYVYDLDTRSWTKHYGVWEAMATTRNNRVYGVPVTGTRFLTDVVLIDRRTANTWDSTISNNPRYTITSFVTTAWLDGGTPAVKKRWRRAEFLMNFEKQSEPALARQATISAFRDWEPATASSTFTIDPLTTTTDAPGRDKYVKGNSLGSARAVSVKIARSGSADNLGTYPWGVDQMVVKYVPRKLR